jgi:hypothetical protein
MRYTSASLTVMMLLGLSAGGNVALAHLPLFDDGTAVDAEHALVISDIGLSQVVYHGLPVHIASLSS